MSRAVRRRLFFALWPEPDLSQQFAALWPMSAGSAVRVDDLHLTVLFLGQIPEGQVADVAAAAAKVHLPAIRQPLVRLEAWPESGVLCLTGDPVAPLEALRRALGRAAAAAGLDLARERKEFRPHVTLGRDYTPAPRFDPPPIEPQLLIAHRFSLAESIPRRDGRRYELLASWPLDL
jgi:RNA 2',3'-cyclic 3'-phosphodiesterase